MPDEHASTNRLIRQKIIQLLAMREHSILEIKQKCAKKIDAPEQIAALIEEYIERGYISEQRFTEDYIRMRRRKGYGPVRIRQELLQRGVPVSLIETHLNSIDHEDWTNQIEQILIKKFGTSEPHSDYKKQIKRARFIEYRGFKVNHLCRLV